MGAICVPLRKAHAIESDPKKFKQNCLSASVTGGNTALGGKKAAYSLSQLTRYAICAIYHSSRFSTQEKGGASLCESDAALRRCFPSTNLSSSPSFALDPPPLFVVIGYSDKVPAGDWKPVCRGGLSCTLCNKVSGAVSVRLRSGGELVRFLWR